MKIVCAVHHIFRRSNFLPEIVEEFIAVNTKTYGHN
jgi:predicted CoA-binding protein